MDVKISTPREPSVGQCIKTEGDRQGAGPGPRVLATPEGLAAVFRTGGEMPTIVGLSYIL